MRSQQPVERHLALERKCYPIPKVQGSAAGEEEEQFELSEATHQTIGPFGTQIESRAPGFVLPTARLGAIAANASRCLANCVHRPSALFSVNPV
jgi:hypothetical protein